MLRLIIVVLLVLQLSVSVCTGQDNKSKDLLKEYFEKAANKQNLYLSSNQIREIPFQQLIAVCESLLSNPNPFVRYKAIDLIKRAGSLNTDPENRQKAVLLLISACRDKDSGNCGSASSGLQLFHSEDFSQQAADSISTLIRNRCFHYEKIIRLGGFINSNSTFDALNRLNLNDSSFSARERWAVNLALARKGDSERLTYCLEKIKLMPLNDNFITYIIPDLVYIRQPSSIDYILEEILSDESKCTSSNPDKEEKITCAFKLIELVAPVIINFPVHLTNYGELDTENYDDTLLIVRQWINQNDSYGLIMNIY